MTKNPFEKFSQPGHAARWTGQYRCKSCGRETVAEKGTALPQADHHKHKVNAAGIALQPPILWEYTGDI